MIMFCLSSKKIFVDHEIKTRVKFNFKYFYVDKTGQSWKLDIVTLHLCQTSTNILYFYTRLLFLADFWRVTREKKTVSLTSVYFPLKAFILKLTGSK